MPNRVNRLMVQMEMEALKDAANIVFVDYCGLSCGEAEELRGALRDKTLRMRVVRNRMFLRALDELGLPDCSAVVIGPTAIIDCECPVTASRTAVEFARRHPALELKGGLIEGRLLERAAIEDLAARGRTKAEWQATIAGCIIGPFRRIASCANVGAKLSGALKSIAEEKTVA